VSGLYIGAGFAERKGGAPDGLLSHRYYGRLMISTGAQWVPATTRQRPDAASDRLFIAAVLTGGLAIRLIWLLRVHGRLIDFLSAAEAAKVALSVATRGSIADAYFPGQGPTAHLLPLNPLISGFLMWLWGPGTTGADLSLLVWSLAQTVCGYLLVAHLFRRLGVDQATQRWGLALLMLVTPFVPQETIDWRYWEGGSALCLGALNLLLMIDLDRSARVSRRMLAAIALSSAAAFFISPPVGLAADCCWALIALRRLPASQCLLIACASAAALALFVAPWAIRNDAVLGTPVLLRSDAGLELAIGNYPGAIDERPDPAHAFDDRLSAVHPMGNKALRPIIMRRGGEVAYSRQLGTATWRWMSSHPFLAMRLCGRHLRRFFFPEPWQFYFSEWEGMRGARAATVCLVVLLGFFGLALGLVGRHRGFGIIALYILIVALPYALVPPVPRYTFLVYPFFAFPAVAAIRWLAAAGGAAWAR